MRDEAIGAPPLAVNSAATVATAKVRKTNDLVVMMVMAVVFLNRPFVAGLSLALNNRSAKYTPNKSKPPGWRSRKGRVVATVLGR